MSNGTGKTPTPLPFESPVSEIDQQILVLQDKEDSSNYEDELNDLQQTRDNLLAKLYKNLTPWQTVQVARHKDRPHTGDYLSLAFDEFVELHGDRHFGDDRAILTGFAKISDQKVMVIGHQKGKTYKERTACSFGCAHPEGYRKALSKMKLAAKFGLPVITFIDTPGAYPGIGAEERGQAWVIAENMYAMSQLETPIICVVIGEGGSGGALGIGVGDRIAMLEHSYYSVISPEGCAGILWKSHAHAEDAAKALRFTSTDLSRLGIVDSIIPEPLGGAHRDHHRTAAQLKLFLAKTLRELSKIPTAELVQQRYDKFRQMGVFFEGTSLSAPESFSTAEQGAS
ncbi:MAG TPA: acetyl-CoA carboxylase carboxyltransferase subunit alpha [Planctomycetaceae bacterium]|nr:acetyl-CoA carboxylase carboxyltransferase subunit alpha [Planctomycetaceae bacterium]